MHDSEIRARLAEGSKRAVEKGQRPWPTYGATETVSDAEVEFLCEIAEEAISRMPRAWQLAFLHRVSKQLRS